MIGGTWWLRACCQSNEHGLQDLASPAGEIVGNAGRDASLGVTKNGAPHFWGWVGIPGDKGYAADGASMRRKMKRIIFARPVCTVIMMNHDSTLCWPVAT